MTKILFLCHGNICRSPMGEYMLRDMVEKAGVADRFEIASAAVSTDEIGSPVYPPAKQELARHGIDCTVKTARQVTRQDLDEYDRIFYMDESNRNWLQWLFGPDADKCEKLLLWDVADPWYTNDFSRTWEDLAEGCKNILKEYGIC